MTEDANSREEAVLQDEEREESEKAAEPSVSDIVKQAVQEALKAYKKEVIAERERVKEEGNDLANSIANAHTQLITPKAVPDKFDSTLKIVENILGEHEAKKQIEIGGVPHYPRNEEGMFKAKVVLYNKMGMTSEEIAKFLLEE